MVETQPEVDVQTNNELERIDSKPEIERIETPQQVVNQIDAEVLDDKISTNDMVTVGMTPQILHE